MGEAIEEECPRTAHQHNAAETFRSGLMFPHKVNAAKSGGSNSTEVTPIAIISDPKNTAKT